MSKVLNQFCRLLVILSVIFFFQSKTFGSENLKQIQQAIQNAGAKWTAGENWVTKLPADERRRLCGSWLEPQVAAEAKLLSIPLIDSLPAQFDWRDNNGNWVTPVTDQRTCGSCWDFSAVAQVEAWWKIHNSNLDSMINLSEQFVLSCSDGTCEGWSPAAALEFIKSTGVPTEACFRYRANDEIPCSDACDNWAAEAIKIPGWGYITLAEEIIDNIKSAVFRHPVSASFMVYTDFMSYQSGVYEYVWGELEAGHAILIVGWNDEEQSWICKNSWNKSWGDNGYFRIKWGECQIGSYMPFIWDEMTGGSALTISPERFDFSLIIGDSVVQDITITNSGAKNLEYSAIDCGVQKITFHPDSFNAWDGLSWWCGDTLLGGYGDHWLQFMDTPIIDLSNTDSPALTWMGYWSIENPAGAESPYDGWDGCNVWVSLDGGQTFNVATPSSPAYNCQSLWSFGHPVQGWNMGVGIAGWGGNSNGWVPVEFDLSAYKSDSVIIRYAFASDMALCTADDSLLYGLFVDDIKISDGDSILFEDHADDISIMERTSFNEPGIADWLEISNGLGVIPPGESETVEMVINTRSLTPGSYHGKIYFTSNDTTRPTVEIPFEMELAAPAYDIAVEKVWLPGDSLVVISSMELGANIKNCGLNAKSDFDVVCNIFDQGQAVYGDTVNVSALAAGESQLVKFKQFLALKTGEFDFVVSLINLGEDYNAYNNIVHSITKVTNLVDGFEAETDFWDFQGGWGRTDASSAHNGSFAVHVNSGSTPYSNNMNAILTYKPGFDLNSVDYACIKYWSRFITERNKDVCYVEISSDSSNWVKADSLTGPGARWKQRAVDLTDFINAGYAKVWLRFRFISDEENTGFGVFIDDVEIYTEDPLAIQSEKLTGTIPDKWNLMQNYPNPFNMSTRIKYNLAAAGEVKIVIYNIQGQVVRNLVQTYQAPGQYAIDWNGCDNYGKQVGTGIYVYQLEMAGHFSGTKKLMLIK